MAQVTSGIRAVLSNPLVYELLQMMLGAKSKRNKLITDYIRPEPHMRILDVGCGPAEILAQLPPELEYVGVDISKAYIDKAIEKYGDRGEFFVQSADQVCIEGRPFDLVIALGLLHHLDDEQATKLLRELKALVRPGGRIVTFDGVYTSDQSPAARFFLNRDRGRNVRWETEYVELASSVYGPENVESTLRTDMTRIPYTHCIMECRS